MADPDNSDNRNILIERIVDNLPALRAKAGITQSDLANILGMGRQTIMAIENKKSKMRWDTFIAMAVCFSKNRQTCDLMDYLDLHIDSINLERE